MNPSTNKPCTDEHDEQSAHSESNHCHHQVHPRRHHSPNTHFSSTQNFLSSPTKTQNFPMKISFYNSTVSFYWNGANFGSFNIWRNFNPIHAKTRTEFDSHDESFQENARTQMGKGKKRLKFWINLHGSGKFTKVNQLVGVDIR